MLRPTPSCGGWQQSSCAQENSKAFNLSLAVLWSGLQAGGSLNPFFYDSILAPTPSQLRAAAAAARQRTAGRMRKSSHKDLIFGRKVEGSKYCLASWFRDPPRLMRGPPQFYQSGWVPHSAQEFVLEIYEGVRNQVKEFQVELPPIKKQQGWQHGWVDEKKEEEDHDEKRKKKKQGRPEMTTEEILEKMESRAEERAQALMMSRSQYATSSLTEQLMGQFDRPGLLEQRNISDMDVTAFQSLRMSLGNLRGLDAEGLKRRTSRGFTMEIDKDFANSVMAQIGSRKTHVGRLARYLVGENREGRRGLLKSVLAFAYATAESPIERDKVKEQVDETWEMISNLRFFRRGAPGDEDYFICKTLAPAQTFGLLFLASNYLDGYLRVKGRPGAFQLASGDNSDWQRIFVNLFYETAGSASLAEYVSFLLDTLLGYVAGTIEAPRNLTHTSPRELNSFITTLVGVLHMTTWLPIERVPFSKLRSLMIALMQSIRYNKTNDAGISVAKVLSQFSKTLTKEMAKLESMGSEEFHRRYCRNWSSSVLPHDELSSVAATRLHDPDLDVFFQMSQSHIAGRSLPWSPWTVYGWIRFAQITRLLLSAGLTTFEGWFS